MRGMSALALCCFGVFVGLAAQQHQHQAKPDHMDHRFDDPERYAKSFDDPARDAWQMPDRVIAALKLAPTASVADIGAGTGYFSMRLAKAVPNGTVYAVDIEPKMVEYMRKRAAAEHVANVTPVLAAASSPNLPRPVDAVIVVDTFHHIPNRVAYFSALKTTLTGPTRVAIVDFRKDAPDGPPPEFRFTADQIVDEMTQAGYELESKHDFLPRQYLLVFTRR